MRLPYLLVPIAALAFISCGGGGNQAAAPSLPGPTNLRSTLGPGPDDFTLTWTAPPSGSVDGYNLESKVGSGSFIQVNQYLIPTYNDSLNFSFNSSANEDTDFTFRMNGEKAGIKSSYSNDVTVRHGLNTPGQPTGEYDWDQSGVSLSWSRNTTLSDGVQIERSLTDTYGTTYGPWTPLSMGDPLASTYLDTTVATNAYYSYRVTNKKGNRTSPTGSFSYPIYTGLATPSQPTATFDFTASAMGLTWTKNTSFNDGVKIERLETTQYGSAIGNWTELTVSDLTANNFLDTTVTLNSYYSYRVTNLRGNSASNTSSASYQVLAGLPAPYAIYANWNSTLKTIEISWYSSSNCDSILLDRAACDSNGIPIGDWTRVATLAGNSTSYADGTTQELTAYKYRVAGMKGSTTSLPIMSYSVSTPMAAPTRLLAIAAEGGTQLTWENHSTAATQVVVRRAPANSNYPSYKDVAILSASTTSYLDPKPALGFYKYAVVAKSGTSESTSNATDFTTPNPPDALTLTSAAKSFPDALYMALLPSGTWALATTSPFGVISNNDPWTPYFPNNSYRSVDNVLQVDALGHPHLVYLMLNPQNSQEAILRHAWFDGSLWQTEDMGKTQLLYYSYGVGYSYTLDGSGQPHALLEQSPYGGSTSNLAYIHKVASIWTQETLSGINPVVSYSSYRLRLDGSNAPHVLLGSWNTLYECTKDPQGSWVAAALPTGTVQLTSNGINDGIWTDAENATLVFSNQSYDSSYGYVTNMMCLRKAAGVWQSPVTMGSTDSGASSAQMEASSDRSRIAVLVNSGLGLKTYHMDEKGWHETLVTNLGGDYSYNTIFRLGFDSSSKAHILIKKTYPTSYTEFKE